MKPYLSHKANSVAGYCSRYCGNIIMIQKYEILVWNHSTKFYKYSLKHKGNKIVYLSYPLGESYAGRHYRFDGIGGCHNR